MRDACDGVTANGNSTANIPSPDPSFICANPADYDGRHEFDSNGGATTTCDATMEWVAAKGQPLYDFSQTGVCDDNAITYLGNMVTVGCCGPEKHHACDGSSGGDGSSSGGDGSSSGATRGALGGGWTAVAAVAAVAALVHGVVVAGVLLG